MTEVPKLDHQNINGTPNAAPIHKPTPKLFTSSTSQLIPLDEEEDNEIYNESITMNRYTDFIRSYYFTN